MMTPSADPVYLYIKGVIGILPERNLNNGEPSLHAALIASAAPQPGEHVVHIGAGVGYYTAIMAELVGASGRVTAIELDAGTRVAFDPAATSRAG
jgi:protein-L-isoaspartate(D-aspartate) O-methyltransferase